MGRQLTEQEVKRFGRVMSGHSKDKDRARRKRKVQGQGERKEPRRPAIDAAEQGDADQEPEPSDEEA